MALAPVKTNPLNVVEAPGITIREFFGHVASGDGSCSFATADVKSGGLEEAHQTPQFDEYVICDEGSIKIVYADGEALVKAGEAVFLPKNLRVKWVWPEATKYTVVCLPAFSPALAGREDEEGTTVAKDSASMQRLEQLHQDAGAKLVAAGGSSTALKPLVFQPVDVVKAPGITITEFMGHVASQNGACSLAKAVVGGASEEAYQAPQFDEYVICTEGKIEFKHAGGSLTIVAGESAFLPKNLRVKWVWHEATKYSVLCVPAFAPDLSGREAEEGSTVAKDSKSMQELENLHIAAKQ